jgi:hypothetical protein
MADLLEDIDKYLGQMTLTKGQKVYYDTMLQAGDDAIGIYEYQGTVPLPQVSGASRSIQIVTRSKSVLVAKKLANAIYKSLLTEDGVLNLTAERWALVIPRQTPFKLKTDDSGRTYYAFNVVITTYID